jgi:hypothetical protein
MGRIEPVPQRLHGFGSEEEGLSLSTVREHVAGWAAGRSPVIRLPLVLYLAWVLLRQMKDREEYGSLLLGGITFLIHEAGHVVFGFAGEFVMVAGGSVLQLAAPVLAGFILWRQSDFFGVAFAGSWLSYSLINLSSYIGDAQRQILPLLGVGSGEPIHDWNYLLTAVGLMEQDRLLAALVRTAGALVGVVSLAVALWICWTMWELRGTRRRSFS